MKSHSDCSRVGQCTHPTVVDRMWSAIERMIRVLLLAVELTRLDPTRIAILLDVWRSLKWSFHREPILLLEKLLGLRRPSRVSKKRFHRQLVRFALILNEPDDRKFLELVSKKFHGKPVTDKMVEGYKILNRVERMKLQSYPDVEPGLYKLMQISCRYLKMGCRLEIACASNSTSASAANLRRTFKEQLTQQFYSCELEAAKPSIVFFRRMSAQMQVELKQTLFIDDVNENCLKAQKLGAVVRRMLRPDSEEQALPKGIRAVHNMREVAQAVEIAFTVHLIGHRLIQFVRNLLV